LKILYCGDSPTVNTGFGVVSKNIVNRLSDRGYKVAVLGINHFGDPYDQSVFPYPIYPVGRGSIDAMFGYSKLWEIADKYKPDLIFFLNDPWVIEKYLQSKPRDMQLPYTKYMAYYPIDAGPLKPSWAKMLGNMDAQITYSNFGKGVVTSASNGKEPDNLYQIYHGVDTSVYKPLVQGQVRAKLGLPQDAFIVGMVARNQYRKRFDILASAFAKFAQDKPNAKLYLHTYLQDVGFDINDLSYQLDLKDKLILTADLENPAHGVSDEELNMIYNTFDVNALISLGDGFGLPVAESMATGCPQLVSDHSCLRELVEGHGGLTVKNAAWLLNTSGINTWGGLSDESDLVNKLNVLYNSQEMRMKLAQEAYDFITQPMFNWETITDQFEEVIADVMHFVRKAKAA
jgi:glycosyltransferase involved in cell wall biosynthesis